MFCSGDATNENIIYEQGTTTKTTTTTMSTTTGLSTPSDSEPLLLKCLYTIFLSLY